MDVAAIDRALRDVSRRLDQAEQACDYDLVLVLAEQVDELLDARTEHAQ